MKNKNKFKAKHLLEGFSVIASFGDFFSFNEIKKNIRYGNLFDDAKALAEDSKKIIRDEMLAIKNKRRLS